MKRRSSRNKAEEAQPRRRAIPPASRTLRPFSSTGVYVHTYTYIQYVYIYIYTYTHTYYYTHTQDIRMSNWWNEGARRKKPGNRKILKRGIRMRVENVTGGDAAEPRVTSSSWLQAGEKKRLLERDVAYFRPVAFLNGS